VLFLFPCLCSGTGLSISSNAQLRTLEGLQNLTTLGTGSLSLSSNSALTNATGLGNIVGVLASFSIGSNPQLETLPAL
jgi:hypothetical protein